MGLTFVVLSAIGGAFGVVTLLHSLIGTGQRQNGQRTDVKPARKLTGRTALRPERLLAAVAAGVLLLAVTRWPVAAVMAGAAVLAIPSVLRRTSTGLATERIEAIAVWTELLRDTLAASAGLAEAVIVTAPVAPPAIRENAVRLSDRLASGVNLADALRAFADDVDDSSCDVVVCALLLAVTARTQKLGDLLGALAESTREEVAMRLRIEASRASSRSSVRTVIVFSLLFVALLMVVARSYLAPLGTPGGELALAAVGIFYASGIALMLRLVRPAVQPRLLGRESSPRR